MNAIVLAGIGQTVALDSLPVHAPAAPMRRGAPVQILRIGPVYDQGTGALVIDVTDELCAELAAATSSAGFAVPIDHGHELYQRQAAGRPHADVGLYGRAAALDHRPGVGLFAAPDWNEAGAAYLAANPGTLFVSPTIQPAGFDPRTGVAVAGRVLHSLSITPTPRQDSLDSLALSRAATGAPASKETPMSGLNGGGVTPPDGEAVTLARAAHNALLARVVEAEAAAKAKGDEVTTLTAQLDAAKTEAEAKAGDVTLLSKAVADLQAERAADKATAEIKAAELGGAIVTDAVRPVLMAVDAPTRAIMLASLAKRPAAVAGHGGTVEVLDAAAQAMAMAQADIAKQRANRAGGRA